MANIFNLNVNQVEAEIRRTIEEHAQKAADLLEQPTRAWSADYKPKFGVETEQQGNDLVAVGGVLEEGPSGKNVYLWTTRGTKPRTIVPRPDNKSGLLVFNSPYYRSTKRGSWGSSHVSRGSTVNRRTSVQHRGVQAREFEEKAAEDMKAAFEDAMADVMRRLAG